MKPQPIETAPRDGTDIIGFWEWATVEFCALMWWDKGDGCWRGYINSVTSIPYDGVDHHHGMKIEPTHWLPYESPFDE